MSRNISAKASVTITAEETAERKTEQGKLIFTKYKGHDCALLIHNDRLRAATFFHGTEYISRDGDRGKAPAAIGSIYIGKIKNVVKNINACFVEIAGGEICFLPMKNASAPYLVNRVYDGRLLEGDELLVQVEREAQKTKQASATAHISLSNDYFVISIGEPRVGYSVNIDEKTKNKINFLFTEMAIFKSGCLIQDWGNLLNVQAFRDPQTGAEYMPKLPSTGCIVRTKAAEAADAGVLLQSFFALTAQYAELLRVALHRSCFSCVKKAPSVIENILGQLAGEEEYQEIVTDNEAVFAELQKIMKKRFSWEKEFPMKKSLSEEGQRKREQGLSNEEQHFYDMFNSMEEKHSNDKKQCMEESISNIEIITATANNTERKEDVFNEDDIALKGNPWRVRFYQDSLLPLSKLYSIESKMEMALERRVWLKSGGYLIIEPTEALTVIDVNSGKYEAKKNADETYLKINLEAAEEIMLQLRLRNLSGIIIVDFINMKAEDERRALLRRLRELADHHNKVTHYKVKTTIIDMTALGLVEITRKKINKPLAEQWADCHSKIEY